MPQRPADYDPSEPTAALCDVPIRENGEPLVDFLDLSPKIRQDRARFDYKRETLLRAGVAERLVLAAERLPQGYVFTVVEGWRPPHIQRRMFQATWNRLRERLPELDDAALRPIAERYTAPMEVTVPPPHTTGAAFDLWLLKDGQPADLYAPFERFDHEGFAFDAPGVSDEARRNRDLMAEAFDGTGITNYPSEYWHWSYGDQGWAYRGGHPAALYGPLEPIGWAPDPRDDVDGPLEFLPEDED